MKIYIEDIAKYEGQTITLQAWLYNKRSSGKLHFLQLRDGTGEIQAVVFKGNVSDEVFELSDKITQESSVEVTGTVKKHDRSRIGYEIDATDGVESHSSIVFLLNSIKMPSPFLTTAGSHFSPSPDTRFTIWG